MDQIKNNYLSNKNFYWLEGESSNKYLIRSQILITDWSGAAFSFSFGLGRPVISVDLPPKINNLEYKKFINEPFEITMREKIGLVINPDRIENITKIVHDIKTNYRFYSKNIIEPRNNYIYNFGKSAEKGAQYLAKLTQTI